MAIKAVFFDIGNVLLGYDWKAAVGRICKQTDFTSEDVGKRFWKSGFAKFEKGFISQTEFFGALAKSIEFTGTVEELNLLCSDIFFTLDDNIAVARRLVGRTELGIISNTNQAHIEFLEPRYDFLDIFKVRIYSHEVNARKPEKEIYDAALLQTNVRAGESLFVDDLIENVEAARQLGWSAIHLEPETDLQKEIERYDLM
ncbi:MAG: HAD family phosphatase [Proteobacteria bacterium]|nr:HAD family phosphatase [Pseudomonadota bacterium]